jgi:histidinol-phosphate/aromatic aminotransferase/cobyric acid decarboxylase-like protein
MAALLERGILVRDWRDPAFPHELRITVGRPDDTRALLDALRDILAAPPAAAHPAALRP